MSKEKRRSHSETKIRMPKKLMHCLKARAAQNNRSVNAEMVALLSKAIESESIEAVVKQAVESALGSVTSALNVIQEKPHPFHIFEQIPNRFIVPLSPETHNITKA